MMVRSGDEPSLLRPNPKFPSHRDIAARLSDIVVRGPVLVARISSQSSRLPIELAIPSKWQISFRKRFSFARVWTQTARSCASVAASFRKNPKHRPPQKFSRPVESSKGAVVRHAACGIIYGRARDALLLIRVCPIGVPKTSQQPSYRKPYIAARCQFRSKLEQAVVRGSYKSSLGSIAEELETLLDSAVVRNFSDSFSKAVCQVRSCSINSVWPREYDVPVNQNVEYVAWPYFQGWLHIQVTL